MPIFRLHLEEGAPLKLKGNPRETLKSIVARHSVALTALNVPEEEIFEIDLTPRWWKNHLYTHHLLLLDSEHAVYVSIPREEEVGLRQVEAGSQLSDLKKGAFVVNIPGDQDLVVVCGPLKDRETIGVYEIIIYVPKGELPEGE